MLRYVTSLEPALLEADLAERAKTAPDKVVRPAYLHGKMRNVKLHVTKGRKISQS